jgi:excisionase family DNA binding protein
MITNSQHDPLPQASVGPVKLLLTPMEAAETLSISRSLLSDLIMRKRTFSVKVVNARRIPFQALRAYVDELCGSESQRAG